MAEPPPTANQNALGEIVARSRNDAGMTLDALAERSMVSRRTLVNIEQGHVSPTVHILHAIAHATGVPMERLISALCVGHQPPGG